MAFNLSKIISNLNTNPINGISPTNEISNVELLYSDGYFIFACLNYKGETRYGIRWDVSENGGKTGMPNVNSHPTWFILPIFAGLAILDSLKNTYEMGYERENINPKISNFRI